jgi:peroxiredoxin
LKSRSLVVFLVVVAAVASAAVGVAVYQATTTPPSLAAPGRAAARDTVPARGTVPAQDRQVASKPQRGRVLPLDAAIKELDLVRPARPKLADDFSLPMPDGTTFRLADQRGKVVFVNFWATWCPPCREEMPAMERLWQRYRNEGLVLVAVSLDADPKVVPPFVKGQRLTFPIVLDPHMQSANAYGVRALPSSFLVDRKGYLAALALGPRVWDNDAGRSLVEGLMR